MNTRIAVPMASAVSFCDNVGDDMRLPPRVFGSAGRVAPDRAGSGVDGRRT